MPPVSWRLVVLGLVLSAVPAFAHPHVWIDVQAEVTIANGYVDGVWTRWTFDDVFSSMIMQDNDPEGTGKITAAVNASIKRTYFDNLRNYDYFSHFALGSRVLKIPPPERFQATIAPDGRVTYRFFLPVHVRLGAQTAFHVSFYDDSFFTDMTFLKKNPVLLTVTDGGSAAYQLLADKSKTYYGGSVTPVFAVIRWSPS